MNRCWPIAPPTRNSPTRSRWAPCIGQSRSDDARPTDRTRGAATPRPQRSRDFWGSAIRLVKRLAPQRRLSIAVITLGITGTAIGVVVPRILGHATDLLFNGVIGRRLPAGITKAQAVAAARARGDNAFADLLSGMNVVPGRGWTSARWHARWRWRWACIWLPRC